MTINGTEGLISVISAGAFPAFPDLDVVAELGRGAETIVYRVRRGSAEYAVKLLVAATVREETTLTAIRREAALLGCVGHPRLPRIFDVGRVAEGPYLVLELIEGSTLANLIPPAGLDETRVVRIAIDVVEPLAAAHRTGLVHRDVKPDNIMVGRDGGARLIDFGLAARGGTQVDNQVAGTLRYTAPEQTGMLKRAVDGRADLYALGAVLFECLTGDPPFRSDDLGELIRQHATVQAPDPREQRPDISPTLAAIVAKLLAKDPDDRYPDGESLLADLRRLAADPAATFEVGTAAGPPRTDEALVGRTAELGQLTGQWRRTRTGHGGAALITGVPGGGKSRLAREIAAIARAEERPVLHGKCVPDDPVPLAPLREAVEGYLRAISGLPAPERDAAVDRIRQAAGDSAALLRPLSPMLADLLHAPELAEQDRQDQFINAVVTFFTRLAGQADGAVLHLDDVQWLDVVSRRVLHQLATELAEVPLLLLATGRNDEDSTAAVESVRADLGAALDTTVTIGPLDDDGVAELVAAHLGGVVVDRTVTDAIGARTAGNPFTLIEYVRAIVDAGLLTPSWDGWRLDADGLDRLELTGDALDLVLRRIDNLGAESRRLLTAGAATGTRFAVEPVARACDVDAAQAADALAEALHHQLVSAEDHRFAFLHDRIREALLGDLTGAELHHLHQRLAEALDAPGTVDDQGVYALARHYALGEPARTPQRAFEANVAAGRRALAEHAAAEALAFLETAGGIAAAAGITADAGFAEAFGLACARTGRFGEALDHLKRAYANEPDAVRRAEVLTHASRVHISMWRPDEAVETVRRGLAELGLALPGNGLVLVVTSLLRFLAGLVVGYTKVGYGTVRGRRRERMRREAVLYDIGGYAASIGNRLGLRLLMSLRSLYLINRLGPGVEYVRHIGGFGIVASLLLRNHKLAARLFDRAKQIAVDLRDPTLVAYNEWRRGVGRFRGGADDGSTWRQALIRHERWLDVGDYLTGAAAAALSMTIYGRTLEAQTWQERGLARLAGRVTGAGEGSAFSTVAVFVPAQFGRAAQAAAGLAELRRLLDANPDNRTQQLNYRAAAVIATFEEGEFGEAFDRAAAALEPSRVKLRELSTDQRVVFVYLAFGRLAQCREFGCDAARLAVASRGVDRLGKAAVTDAFRAYHRVAAADLEVVRGRPAAALGILARAEPATLRLDAPLVDYEVARVRARALRALGESAAAERQARSALQLAVEQHWTYRARWIRAEFDVREASMRSIASTSGTVHGSAGALSNRRLEALQQMGLAAATVLDPRELAKVALDETVRILGAERAYLFLYDAAADQLVPHVGRDSDGESFDELTGYSSTLVERVRDTRTPLVVTGSEEGAALGSQSALVHGLRSIMIAPLLFDTRLLGVVYLDSRVAKGIFTTDDVDILTAITNHVAVSLETARAAQLEVVAQAARRQRDVAETLRAAMAAFNDTLDQREVIQRLLGELIRIVPGDSAALVVRDGTKFVIQSGAGSPALEDAAGLLLDPAADPPLAASLALTAPQVGTARPGHPAPMAELLGTPQHWLATPATERGGHPLGVLLVGSNDPRATEDAQVELAAALVGQAMTAYENARLFGQVQRMATVDGLTELSNRSHFFTEANRLLMVASRHARPVGAIMLDIDHFKRVNDTYGHPVGDDVIRTVAARLRASVRESDLLCRYGGEEFALLTPETGADTEILAERLRTAVAGRPIDTGAGPLDVTISVGVTFVDGEGVRDLETLLARADGALYEAKQAGRNRVRVATG